MIRFPCSGCEKKLSVRDELAGRIAVCPHCKTKVRIPQPETAAEEDPEPEGAEEPDDSDVEMEVVSRPGRRVDRDEDKPLPGRTGRKRRRRVRGSGGRERISWWDSLSVFDKVVFSALGVGLVAALLSVALPPLAAVSLFLAAVFLLIGIGSMLQTAFQEGIGCLIVIPLVGVFFVLRSGGSKKFAVYWMFSFLLAITTLPCVAAGAWIWHTFIPSVHIVPW